LFVGLFAADGAEKPPQRPLRVDPPPIASDKSVKYDYDIVYVRAPRFIKGSDRKERQAPVWPNAAEPENLRAPTDLMLLHPDGSEEVLVEGGQGAVADPYVSFDAQWVYYSYFHDVNGSGGADVYKVHARSRKVVRLTQQRWTPNTGAVDGKTPLPRGVYNMHPCPLLGGRIAFVSNRDGMKAPRLSHSALQLFVMDDDGANVEKIGHLNVGQALHPVILTDGRIIFSSLEVQGKHNTGWGILGIRPDGTGWNPVVSALSLGGAPIPFHFQTQLSDGSIIVENYYTPAMGGFGVYFKQPPQPPGDTPAFGPAKASDDPRMTMMRSVFRMPFQPYGMEVLTRFTHNHDSPALRADPNDPTSPHTGWVTQPCGAPDNHLLTVWSGVMPARQGRIIDDKQPPVDAGIYLIKDGKPFWEPGEMLLIKNDPKYNEQWPRPLVPYKRIYGVDEPQRLSMLANDGKLSPHLPEGTPFGLVGTSSLYKRESYPLGIVPKGSVTAVGAPYAAFPTREHRTNWDGQGADAGLYSNSDIHAIRILVMEPPSIPVVGRFQNHAGERLRILGEIPVRKFDGDKQPLDPDGNPDTSFLARIPADVAWTFQTLDRDGMVLNMAQTWHQLRPGEIRTNCGGCHAHSQKPTLFQDTAAAKADYRIFDLTLSTPLLTTKKNDQSGRRWDVKDETGLRYAQGVLNVEYLRDIRPIFERSCVACHSGKAGKPAGNLVLDDDTITKDRQAPAAYYALVHRKDTKAQPYVWPSQSRNSLLTWKVFGRRTDGFPEKLVSGAESDYSGHINRGGQPYRPFTGSVMPPPEAVAGTYDGPDGQKIKVAPLSDEDRRMLVRWIDLGCPLDRDFDPKVPQKRGRGWMLDDQRPTLTLTYPRAGANEPMTRILIGMYDYDTGLDMDSFQVVADFAVDGTRASENLAPRFKALPDSRWELTPAQPIKELPRGKLTVVVRDRQGNETRIERSFSIRP
jgi:hypothetical protein